MNHLRALIGTLTVMVVIAAPAMAEVAVTFPVSIPQECVELAQREGVPLIIENKYQAAKAKVKLARLNYRDPLVRQCRQAVEQRKIALQNNR
jgi:hypothetical protein